MSLNGAPMSGRIERKKEETKQKIITAALRLFREQGLEATTMERIAAETDIAKGTLYNYFPVKEAILDEYIRRSFKDQNAERVRRVQALPDTRSRLVQVFQELMAGVQAQKAIFEKYVMYRMRHWVSFRQEPGEKSGFELAAAEIIRLGLENGEIRTDLGSDLLVDLCEYVFMLVVKQFYLEPQGFDARQAIERSVDLFMNGAKAGPQ